MIQCCGNKEMIFPQTLLSDLQSPPKQILCLFFVVTIVKKENSRNDCVNAENRSTGYC